MAIKLWERSAVSRTWMGEPFKKAPALAFAVNSSCRKGVYTTPRVIRPCSSSPRLTALAGKP